MILWEISPPRLPFITILHPPFHSSNTAFHLSAVSKKHAPNISSLSCLFSLLHFRYFSDRTDGVKLPHTVNSCSINGMSYRFPSTLHSGRNVRKLLITSTCLCSLAASQSLCCLASPHGWKKLALKKCL